MAQYDVRVYAVGLLICWADFIPFEFELLYLLFLLHLIIFLDLCPYVANLRPLI